jgi:hypothetical protein
MISLFGTTLGSTAPWLLLGVPIATALLVYVYRNLGTSQHAVVSTLLFLRELPQRPTSRKRFIPPFQFWIELTALSLLSLAGAGVFLSNTGRKIAIVIDRSLSMEAPGSDGTRRIDAAKRLAIADITQSLPTTRFSLFSAQSNLKPLSSEKLTAGEAASLISPLTTVPAEDRLQLHLPQLVGSGEYDSVWVYTDRSLGAATVTPSVRVVSVADSSASRPLGNVWMRGISTKKIEGRTFLSVSLEQIGAASLPITISATCYEANGASGSSRSRMVPDTTVEAPNGVSTTTQLGPLDFPWSYCRAHAVSNSPGTTDLITNDNDAWITSDAVASTVALISPLSPEQLKIERIGGFSVVASSPTPAQERSVQSPIIVHRSPAPKEPQSSTLLVFPPVGPLPWGGAVRESENRPLQISRWNNAHPVMTYVNPTLLNLQATRVIECPPSATSILTTTIGTVACVGEHQGARYAVMGFEIFPFDGSKTPTLSILTLNLFKWLFEAQTSSQKIVPFDTLALPRGVTEASYLAPGSNTLAVSERSTITPETPGVIRLSDATSGVSFMKAVNLLSDQESNLAENAPISLSFSDRPSVNSSKESFDIAPWLATLAVLVLLFDLIRRIARVTRWSRS